MDTIKSKLQTGQSITVLTGAGISAESGVPTFRGSDGLWKNFRPEKLATLEAFQADPCLVWEWYDWRRKLIEPIEPNPAHYVLVDMENQTEQFTLITQNIDGLHHKAGSQNVLEIHGNIWKVQCTKCQCLSHNSEVPIQILPTCHQCGGLLRPKVVWFGETLPAKELAAAQLVVTHCDLMFIIGTSGLVQPAASLGIAGKQAGAYVVEINVERTPLSNIADETRIGKASDVLIDLLS